MIKGKLFLQSIVEYLKSVLDLFEINDSFLPGRNIITQDSHSILELGEIIFLDHGIYTRYWNDDMEIAFEGN